RFEREDVGRLLDPALLEEQRDLLLSQPFDVEGAAGGEMLQMLDFLRRGGELAGAARDRPPPAGGGRVAHGRRGERAPAGGPEICKASTILGASPAPRPKPVG